MLQPVLQQMIKQNFRMSSSHVKWEFFKNQHHKKLTYYHRELKNTKNLKQSKPASIGGHLNNSNIICMPVYRWRILSAHNILINKLNWPLCYCLIPRHYAELLLISLNIEVVCQSDHKAKRVCVSFPQNLLSNSCSQALICLIFIFCIFSFPTGNKKLCIIKTLMIF